MGEEKEKSSGKPSTESKRPHKRATAHLKSYQFKPGQSGNPGGRPKKTPIADAVIRRAMKKLTKAERARLNMRYGNNWADVCAEWLLQQMMRSGNTPEQQMVAFREFKKTADQEETKAPTVGVAVGEGGTVVLSDESVYDRARQLQQQLDDRLAKRRAAQEV